MNRVKRAIGIDLSDTHIRAVQMSRRAEVFHIEKAFYDDDPRHWETPSQWLQFLITEHDFARRATVAWSMPYDKLFFHRVQTDPADGDSANDMYRADIEDDFPLPIEDTIADVVSQKTRTDPSNEAIITAVSRSALQEQLVLTKATKARNTVFEAPIFAVYNSVALNHPDLLTAPAILLYTEAQRSLIAITDTHRVLGVRNLPNPGATLKEENTRPLDRNDLLLREIELTWRSVWEDPIPEDTPLVVAGGAVGDTELQNHLTRRLPCCIQTLNTMAQTVGRAPHHTDASFCMAEGLALRALNPDDTMGIHPAYRENTQNRKPVSIRKQVIGSLILLGVLAAVYLSAVFYRLAQREGQYAHLKDEIRQEFQQTLPEETTIVNELAQMQTRLHDYQANSALWQHQTTGQTDPLDVLHWITVRTPSNLGITIQDMYITPHRVRLTAVCNSFQDPYDWQALLKKQTAFASVDIQDLKKPSSSEPVRFGLLLELKPEL